MPITSVIDERRHSDKAVRAEFLKRRDVKTDFSVP